MDGPYALQRALWFAFCNTFSPDLLKPVYLLVGGLNALKNTNHKDYPCTFEKLETKSKNLKNHKDYPCSLLLIFLLTKPNS
ncbi:hypothetical protein HanRHA438_Chr04g0190151 [Helianthus annuus]|nr:hypothetical protein HanRHA438_Chr04g0190151 [Helianthus annuus]